MLAMLLNPSWVSSLLPQPWLHGLQGWTTLQLPPGKEKEDESQDGAGMAERGMPEEGVN